MKFIFYFATALLALPLAAGALGSSELPDGVLVPPASSTVSCFDYYHFGSVSADLVPSVSTVVSGTAITFSGVIKNNNPYPIVDGALYVKIFRDRGTGKDVNGPDVVDQFVVRDHISLPAQGTLPETFSWQAPAYGLSGTYKIATFFSVNKKYNLLGLTFTDDVVGNTSSFKIVGETQDTVGFDRTMVKVNGGTYRFAAFAPTISATSSATITATVSNTSAAPQQVQVDWRLYHWDAADSSNQITSQSTSVAVPAHSSKIVTFSTNDTRYPVYLLTGTVHYKDTASIINVRFVRTGIDRIRINFPAVTSYPLSAGSSTTLFSCLHNSGTSATVPNGRLKLSLTDDHGDLIHSYTYTGNVTSSMMGVADTFTPDKTYDRFTLDAKLYQGDTLIDSAHIAYDCATLAPALCAPASPSSSLRASLAQKLLHLPILALLILAILLAAISLFVVFWTRRGEEDSRA